MENGDLEEENTGLKEENIMLRQIDILKYSSITPETLKENDSRVRYYTGLPSYEVFEAVFLYVTYITCKSSLPLMNQLLMLLTRLRNNSI